MELKVSSEPDFNKGTKVTSVLKKKKGQIDRRLQKQFELFP